jgi:hypothetical protein
LIVLFKSALSNRIFGRKFIVSPTPF